MQALKIIGAVISILTGLFSIVLPERAAKFVHLQTSDNRGRTEIRAVLGGVYLAVGVAPFFFLNAPELWVVWRMAGVVWLGTALTRAVSMFFLDNSYKNTTHLVSWIVEIVVGVIFFI